MVEIDKQKSPRKKLLIIRFSSVGDVLQTLGVIAPFLDQYPNTEIHWTVRDDLKDLLASHPKIHKIWFLKRKDGFKGLKNLKDNLIKEEFDFVYDAHNNLRSYYLCSFLKPQYFVRRSKNRFLRFLLFQLGINLFPQKFIQEESFVTPLKKWGILYTQPTQCQLYIDDQTLQSVSGKIPFKKYVALVPSAAWELKKWPTENFKKLIDLMPETSFVILGGPEDHFCQEIVDNSQKHRVLNFAGKLSLIESCAVIHGASLTIGNDTGMSHAADQIGRPLIQLIGPVLFGYPAKKTSHVLEIPLKCRPCSKDGRGTCKNPIYKQCLVDITPQSVASIAKAFL